MKPHPGPTNSEAAVLSFLLLRRWIGWLGVSLPAILMGVNYLSGCSEVQDSISHYFYTTSGSVFVGLLCTVGLFLITYRGYDKTPDGKTDHWDQIISTAAGIGAIGVALFPANNMDTPGCALSYFEDSAWRNTLHYVFAAVFFLMLAVMSYFRFTISKTPKALYSPAKKRRHFLYRCCALLIVICILLIPLSDLFLDTAEHNTTFWLEWVAMIAFGTAWLVKGKMFLADAA